MKEKLNVSLNLHLNVSVKLTDYGIEVLNKYYQNLNLKNNHIINGLNEIVLPIWEMSQIFGQCLYLGNTKIPFVNNELIVSLEEDSIENFRFQWGV